MNRDLPYRAKAFLGLLFIGVLTLWVPGYWPVASFLCGMFLLTALEVVRLRDPEEERRTKGAIVIIALTVLLPICGTLQILLRRTVYEYPTWVGIAALCCNSCVVYLISGFPSRILEKLRLCMLSFAFVVAVASILQTVTAGKALWVFNRITYLDPMHGPTLYHNHWAAFVEATLPIATYYALRSPSRRVWLYFTMTATLYASVIASASRSGTIICTAEILIVPVLVARRYQVPLAVARAILPLISTLGLFTVIAGPELVIQRFTSGFDTSLGRANWNLTSIAMLKRSTWHGAGVGNWPTIYPQFATADLGVYVNQAHNDWLQWAVEAGLFSAAILTVAVISCFYAWWFPWSVGVLAVFGQALVDYPFSRPALAAWIWSVFGMALASRGLGYRGRVDLDASPRPCLQLC